MKKFRSSIVVLLIVTMIMTVFSGAALASEKRQDTVSHYDLIL